jgi:hypothetical protein
MFIASTAREPPARFGGAEHNLTSTSPRLFRPSEPRRVLRKARAINMALLRSEEPHHPTGYGNASTRTVPRANPSVVMVHRFHRHDGSRSLATGRSSF